MSYRWFSRISPATVFPASDRSMHWNTSFDPFWSSCALWSMTKHRQIHPCTVIKHVWFTGTCSRVFLKSLASELCKLDEPFKVQISIPQTAQTHFTFTFINLADAFIQSNLQLRNTISDTIIKRQTVTGSACNTTFQALLRVKTC